MAKKILIFLRAHLLLLPVLAIGLYFVSQNAFMQDDAYISYNYAKWFSRGYGLVWYPGSTEFGYTNFFYTFMIGMAMLLRIPPEIASNTINTISFIGCMFVGYAMAVRLLKSRSIAALCMLLLATHHSFTAYGTGGLETMWVTLLVLLFYWHIIATEQAQHPSHFLRIGTLAALAMLSRLDTVLLIAPGYAYLLLTGLPRFAWQEMIHQLRRMQHAVVIPAITLIGFFIACYVAYGHVLPTTFSIKIPGSTGLTNAGLHYLVLYNMLHCYLPLMVPLLIVYFFFRWKTLRRMGRPAGLIAMPLAVWLCYIAYIGGDFMEFRFLVPVLVFYHVLVFKLVLAALPNAGNRVSLAVFIVFLLGNMLHSNLFVSIPGTLDFNQVPKKFEYAFVESTDTLNEWVAVRNVNWKVIGQGIRDLFKRTDGVIFSTSAIGAISYYSDLKVFDVLGLNSRIVLEQHKSFMARAGHAIIATDSLLVSESVNLNIAHPYAVCMRLNRYLWSFNAAESFPFRRHQTLFIPLSNGCYVVADYVTPHPKIEELLKNKTIIRYRDVARQSDCPDWLCLR